MAQIRFWGVLGRGSAGKSTVIGHLMSRFGAGLNGVDPNKTAMRGRVLLRGGGYLTFYLRRQSVQEANIGIKEIIDIVNSELERQQRESPTVTASYLNVLLALRLEGINRLPTARRYLNHFVQQGWSIESLVLLNPVPADDYFHRFGAPILNVYRPDRPSRLPHSTARGAQIGTVVGHVRNHFGWA